MSISLSTGLQHSGVHRMWVFPVLGELGWLVTMLGSGKCSQSSVFLGVKRHALLMPKTCSWVK